MEIDPNFVSAHNHLAIFYNSTDRPAATGEYAKKAYALKDQVSDIGQLMMTFGYHLLLRVNY